LVLIHPSGSGSCNEIIGVVKTNYACYPKKFIEETMQEWPPGSHIVLETKTPEGIDLLAVGYKYNKRTVTCFLTTKDAGHTGPGVSYEAKWKDDNNNTCKKDIPRPYVVAKYFSENNGIDLHNQSRQFDLKLEKFWVTHDGFFRCITTIFGMLLTDAWKAYMFHLNPNHRHKKISIRDFVKIVCKDMLTNPFTKKKESEIAMTILKEVPVNGMNNQGLVGRDILSGVTHDEATVVSALTDLSSVMASTVSTKESILGKHSLVQTDSFVCHSVDGREGKRRKRGKCMYCVSNTSYMCPTCPPKPKAQEHWCCPVKSKKTCHTKHITAVISKQNTAN
jgi:hypothetical protein